MKHKMKSESDESTQPDEVKEASMVKKSKESDKEHHDKFLCHS